GAQGGAADRFYLSGHSAGGHLAAMTALRRDRWADAGVPADLIRGCLPISGIMDLYHPAPTPGSLEERVYTT
ncbi:MAG: alpha/beta hydrolase fold domain-containing protein, partial [Rhodoferax sp.]|nr:alpha/beta hydrolase fold domain-containing protein [Rhodoferax sp.]